MPPYLPWHSAMIVISGIAEIVLGFCLVINSLSRPAAWGLIALLIAIFPVHIHMLTHSELYPDIPVAILWLRIALQAVLILWAFWYTRGNPLP